MQQTYYESRFAYCQINTNKDILKVNVTLFLTQSLIIHLIHLDVFLQTNR